MFITRLALPRRTFLRGVGASLALPLLESMVPAFTALAQTRGRPPRQRFGAVYIPNGAVMAQWIPKTGGHRLRADADHEAARAVHATRWSSSAICAAPAATWPATTR